MENPDIFRRLALDLDIATLVNFGRESRWRDSVMRVMRDATFWKAKVLDLLGKESIPEYETDWNQLYLALEESIEELRKKLASGQSVDIADKVYEPALGDLAILRTFLDILPAEPILNVARDHLHKLRIRSVEVLNWLVDNGYIPKESLPHLSAGAIYNDSVSVLAELYSQGHLSGPDQSLPPLLFTAVERGSIKSFKFGLDKVMQLNVHLGYTTELLKSALASNRVDIVRLLLEKLGSNFRYTSDILSVIIQMLESEHKDIISSSREAIDWLTAHQYYLLSTENERVRETLRDIIFYDSGPPETEDGNRGYANAVEVLLQQEGNRWWGPNLLDELEDDSDYSLLLCMILLRKPSSSSLLDWMIHMKKRAFQLAASNVLENNKPSNAIEALLDALLYSQSSLSNIISDLRSTGASNVEMINAAYLIGSQLGYKELRRRE
ncbi:Hypothetical protein POVR2_LOCUS114 [uncultured virus]|nr:Hypothetical protein POVR2_LOCUS114 [uncultured virus]